MSVFVIFAVAGAITCALRCSMVVLGDRLNSSAFVESTIGLVSPAVLSAIIVSAIVLDHGEIVAPDLAGVLAVAAAVVAVHRTSNVGMALAAGLPTYWCCSALTAVVAGG